jgi:hypothetical protein
VAVSAPVSDLVAVRVAASALVAVRVAASALVAVLVEPELRAAALERRRAKLVNRIQLRKTTTPNNAALCVR